MKVGIIGTGSWGTALGQILADNEIDVLMWGRNLDEIVDIHKHHLNETYFPGVKLNPALDATTQFEDLLDADIILVAVPTGAVEDVVKNINDAIQKPVIIINVAKGLHPVTHELLADVIERVMDEDKLKGIVSLIGPSHAELVVEREITTINAVSNDESLAELIQQLFSNDYFRVYTNTDVIGSQIAAATKNIIAVASGALMGMEMGDNARAALMTRGLAEMTRLGVAMGGRPETFLGLCGVGDLIVTCTSIHSRNFQAGLQIGKEDSANHFIESNTRTVEGYFATKAIFELAKELKVSMPITEQIYEVLYMGQKPSIAITKLMQRELKAER